MFNLDQLIIEGDRALRILSGSVQQSRKTPQPEASLDAATLSEQEKKHAVCWFAF